MIEFSRLLLGQELEVAQQQHEGSARPAHVLLADVTMFEPRLYVRNVGWITADASYARVKRLVNLLRNQMGSLTRGDA